MIYKAVNILKLLVLLMGYMFTTTAFELKAQTTLWVTHPQVAYDLNAMAQLYGPKHQSFKAATIFKLSGSADIHQFTPSPTQLKALLKHSPLIVGPLTHQPWLKLAQTSGLLPDNNKEILILAHLGATNHYWLNPKTALSFEKKIQKFLNQLSITYPSTTPWSDKIKIESEKIKELIKHKHIKRVVLTHNSLSYLFKHMDNIELLTLYGAGDDHHQAVSAIQLKKIYQWARKPDEMLFIFEKNLATPSVLTQEALFKKVKTIEWAPIGPSPLKELRKALEQVL